MSVLKQFHRVLEDESARLYLHRIDFGRRWDIRLDMRDLDDHNRRCRGIVRFFKDKKRVIANVGYGGLNDIVVDVDHWGVEE